MARRCRTVAVKQGGSFKGRQFTADVILWAVRWYLMFPISYRDGTVKLSGAWRAEPGSGGSRDGPPAAGRFIPGIGFRPR